MINVKKCMKLFFTVSLPRIIFKCKLLSGPIWYERAMCNENLFFFLSFFSGSLASHNPCEYLYSMYECNVNLSMCSCVTFSCHWNIISLFTWNVCWLKVKRIKKKFFSNLLSFLLLSMVHQKKYNKPERWKTASTFSSRSLACHRFCLQ